MQVRRLLAVIAVAAVLSSVGACSDDEAGPSGSPSPSGASVSPSVTETQPSVPSEPVPPAAMERDDAEGAKAFAEYYWEVVNYAQATGRTERLRSLATTRCSGCAAGVREVEDLYSRGGRIEGGQAKVRRLAVQRLHVRDEEIFDLTFSIRVAAHRYFASQGAEPVHVKPVQRRMHMTLAHESERGWLVGLLESL